MDPLGVGTLCATARRQLPDRASPLCRAAVLVAGALAAARAALGVVALAVPERVARPWVGEGAASEEARVLGRALGGRDLALGLGAAVSLARGSAQPSWVAAGALADLVDASVTVARFARLPDRGRWVVLASAGGAAVLGLAALAGLRQSQGSSSGA